MSLRKMIIYRGTWGPEIQCLFFLVGYSRTEAVTVKAKEEQEAEGDILFYPAVDSYQNLTYKVIIQKYFISCTLSNHSTVVGNVHVKHTEYSMFKRQYASFIWRR